MPCNTQGKDATKDITLYSTTTTAIITDLQAISAKVGRIETRGQWGIIDRSGGLVKTVFVEEDDESDTEDDSM
jgi:hypothetical protein